MNEKEFFNTVMAKIKNLENLQRDNIKQLEIVNDKINQLGVIMMLNDVFEDLEEDENI